MMAGWEDGSMGGIHHLSSRRFGCTYEDAQINTLTACYSDARPTESNSLLSFLCSIPADNVVDFLPLREFEELVVYFHLSNKSVAYTFSTDQ